MTYLVEHSTCLALAGSLSIILPLKNGLERIAELRISLALIRYILKIACVYNLHAHTYQVWHTADNNLLFTNSYKMKMAIIFGMMQMTLGIVMNVYNYTHFNKRRSIFTEFIPQLTFLMSIFGYLVILVFYKWFADWSEFSPPGLLNTLIYMFLQPGTIAPKDLLYPGQVCDLLFHFYYHPKGVCPSGAFARRLCVCAYHAVCQALLRVLGPPPRNAPGLQHRASRLPRQPDRLHGPFRHARAAAGGGV